MENRRQVLELKSERLALEPLQPRHAHLLFQTLSDPSIYTFIPFDPPKSVEALIERYGHLSVGHSADGKDIWLNFAIRQIENDIYVGTVQATVTGKLSYVAYELGPQYWGKGYATEAVRVLIGHLFTVHGVEVIRAETDTRNDRSATLLQRLGFVKIERKENADHFKGSPSHEFVYELLQENWDSVA